jgi:hypothetical protein
MVQKSPTVKISLEILLRVFLFFIVLIVGYYSAILSLNFLVNNLGYKETCSGFFCLPGIAIALTSFAVSYSFWLGVIFGTLGKKFDYFLIAIFVAAASLTLYNFEFSLTLGLVVVATLGSLFGFVLKLLRQRFLRK